MEKNNRFKFLIGASYVLLALFFLTAARLEMFDVKAVLEYFAAKGVFGSVMLASTISVAALLFFPTNVLGMTAGVLLSTFSAFFTALAGLALASLTSFFIGRYLIKDFARKKFGEGAISNILQENDQSKLVKAVLSLRMTPFFPYGIVNYAFSITKIRVRNYLAATVIGLSPKIIFHTLLGGSIRGILTENFLLIPVFLSLLVLLIIAYALLRPVAVK